MTGRFFAASVIASRSDPIVIVPVTENVIKSSTLSAFANAIASRNEQFPAVTSVQSAAVGPVSLRSSTVIVAAIAGHRAAADAFLAGRQTFEDMRGYWPKQTDDTTGVGDYLDTVAKYVVSGTLERADWNNTTVIGGDLDGVRALKSQQGGDILVAGSGRLVAGLVEHDLVDEYRLMVFPTILGRGQRLFPESDATADLELIEARPSADVTLMILRPKRS